MSKSLAFRLYSAVLSEVCGRGGNQGQVEQACTNGDTLYALGQVIRGEAVLIRKVELKGRAWTLTFAGDKIIALKAGKFDLELGGEVVANGKYGVPAGTHGRIVELSMPDQQGRTSNVISVLFEQSRIVYEMKLKDLMVPDPEALQARRCEA